MNRENSTRLPHMQVEYIDEICYPLYKVHCVDACWKFAKLMSYVVFACLCVWKNCAKFTCFHSALITRSTVSVTPRLCPNCLTPALLWETDVWRTEKTGCTLLRTLRRRSMAEMLENNLTEMRRTLRQRRIWRGRCDVKGFQEILIASSCFSFFFFLWHNMPKT